MSGVIRFKLMIHASEDPALYEDLAPLNGHQRGRRIRTLMRQGLAVESEIAAVVAPTPKRKYERRGDKASGTPRKPAGNPQVTTGHQESPSPVGAAAAIAVAVPANSLVEKIEPSATDHADFDPLEGLNPADFRFGSGDMQA